MTFTETRKQQNMKFWKRPSKLNWNFPEIILYFNMEKAKFVKKYQRKYNKSFSNKKIWPYNGSKNLDIQGVPIQKPSGVPCK